MSTWLVVMVLYLSFARARFGRVRRQPPGSSPQSTVTPFHRPPFLPQFLPLFHHGANPFSLPFGLLAIVVRHFVPCPRGLIQSRHRPPRRASDPRGSSTSIVGGIGGGSGQGVGGDKCQENNDK